MLRIPPTNTVWIAVFAPMEFSFLSDYTELQDRALTVLLSMLQAVTKRPSRTNTINVIESNRCCMVLREDERSGMNLDTRTFTRRPCAWTATPSRRWFPC